MNSLGPEAPYWSQDAAALSAALGSGPGGLSSGKAAATLRRVGPNSVEDASHPQRTSVASSAIREPACPHSHIMLQGWKNMHPEQHYIKEHVDLYEHIDDPSRLHRKGGDLQELGRESD
jgi:hypothetical protein